MTEINIPGLAKEMEQRFPEILFAFIFGSAVNGYIREGGDLDLAVYLSDPMKKMEMIPSIISLTEDNTKGAPCDLLLLNDAGVLIALEVLKGYKLFVRNEALDLYCGFYSYTCREYEYQSAWMKKQLENRNYEVQWYR